MKLKYPHPQSLRWSFWRWFDIPSSRHIGLVYLRRLILLQTPWFSFYVHWINEPDSDRHLHNHPWNFWSYILRGGYVERVAHDPTHNIKSTITTFRELLSLHKMPLASAHRIEQVLPGTVTVVVTGRRVRVWGFFTDAGFIPWRRYLRDLAPPSFGESRESRL